MKILIIGSKGFIGSNLVKYFQDQNCDVYECDVSVDYGNSFYSQVDPVDLSYDDVFKLNDYVICINCSGAANVSESISNPVRDFQLNVRNTYLILDSLRKYQPDCKFINLSSAAVYGNPQNLPIRESDRMSPISPYGYHKKLAEDICDQFHDIWGLEVCTLRIFSTYGNGLKKQLFWDLYKKIEESTEIVLFGTGNESRDFIHVTDLARAVDRIIEDASFSSEKINVANGQEVFIKDAVSVLIEKLGFSGKIIFSGEQKQGDPSNWKADISSLKSYGYESKIDLDSGLADYAEWVVQQS